MAYSNFIEVFDSVNTFSAAINSRELNDVAKKNNYIPSHTCSESFAGTPDYQTANKLLTNGDGANLDKLQAVYVRTMKVANELKNTLVKSVCGGVPLVPLAIMGVPKNMLATRKSRPVAKVVNIVYSSTFAAGVPAEDIVVAGAKVASLIKAFESRKVRVNLYSCVCSRKDTQTICTLVNIKKAAAPLNMLRIAYPLINPSFLRRSWFRWLETCPASLNKDYRKSYGYVVKLNDYTAKKMITEKIGENVIMIDGCEMIDADVDAKAKEIFSK